MTASYEPLGASSCRLESPSSRGFLGILLVALKLLLPIGSDACDDPPEFVSMKPINKPAPPYDSGYRVEYDCRPGYRRIIPPIRPTTIVCQDDNTWAPPLREVCTRKACVQLTKPINGKINFINGTTELGSQVHYACNVGFYLFGTKTLRCELYGNNVDWSHNPPQCEKIFCQPPKQIQNGDFTNSHKGYFAFNEIVTYRCHTPNGTEKYSLVGESQLTCIGHNQWSSDPPECKEVLCLPPKQIPNGDFTNSDRHSFTYKEVVIYSCKPSNETDKYSLVGESKLTCIGHNKWSSDPPECKVRSKSRNESPARAYDLGGGLIAVVALTVLVGVAVVATCVYRYLHVRKRQ